MYTFNETIVGYSYDSYNTKRKQMSFDQFDRNTSRYMQHTEKGIKRKLMKLSLKDIHKSSQKSYGSMSVSIKNVIRFAFFNLLRNSVEVPAVETAFLLISEKLMKDFTERDIISVKGALVT